MATHDPRKVLETLRNHLTQPETNISFLFGAGASSAVRIPLPPDQDGETAVGTRALIPNNCRVNCGVHQGDP